MNPVKQDVIKEWLEAAKVLLPLLIQMTNPKLAPLASKISYAIQEAEALKDATGQDKLLHVKNIAHTALDIYNTESGHVVIDPAELDATFDETVKLVVDVINLVSKVKTYAAVSKG